MSATRTKAIASSVPDESPAVVPQTTPKGIGYGHPEYQFVQAIMEMQKSLGEINSSITALRDSVDSTKSKVDGLVQWKHMIVGGVFVLGLLTSGFAFVVAKAWDYISFKVPAAQVQQTSMATTQPEVAQTSSGTKSR